MSTIDVHTHMSSIARGGAINLVGAGVSAVAGFALVLVVTNGFSPDVAGTFFALTSIYLLLVAASSLGIDAGLGRFMLRFVAQGRNGDIPLVLRAAFRPVLCATLTISVITYALADPVAGILGLGDNGASGLRLLVVIFPASVIADCALSGTRSFGRMRTTVLVDKIFRSIAQPILVLVASVMGLGLTGLVAGWAVPYLVTAVASVVLFRSFVGRRVKGAAATTDYHAVRRQFWSFTWARGITRLSQLAIQRADIIIIAALRSPTEAAIYTAATRFVTLGQFGGQAIQQVLQPKFTALLAAEDHETLASVYRTSTAWTMAVSWPWYLLVGCAPTLYLALFGGEYRDSGVSVVVIMALAMLFSVATGPADTLLLMHGRSALSLFNGLVALTIDIVLCFVLIPQMGMTGAAVAWAIAVAVRSSLAVIQLQMILRLSSLSRAGFTVISAAVLCFVAPTLTMNLTGLLSPLTLVAAALVGGGVYAFLLWLARDLLLLRSLNALVRRKAAGA